MAVYIMKVTKLVRDTEVLWFRNAADAEVLADWMRLGGREWAVKTYIEYIECPMIDGVVYVPDYVD